jgi:hypothetical protein
MKKIYELILFSSWMEKKIAQLLKRDFNIDALEINKQRSGQGEVFEIVSEGGKYILKMYDSKKVT